MTLCIIIFFSSHFITDMANIDPLAEDLISLDESEDITDNSETMSKDTNCYMRDTIMGLHRYVKY